MKTHAEFLEELKDFIQIQLKINRNDSQSLLSPGIDYLANVVLKKIEEFENQGKEQD